MSDKPLDGRVAFITGAARGQGRAHAVRLARDGARIIGLDLCADVDTVKYGLGTKDDLDETVAAVQAVGSEMIASVGDVRDLTAVETAVEKGFSEFGRLDIVVANAGIVNGGLTWELTPEQWKDIIDVNLTGVWHTVRATVPIMIKQGTGGAIVLTSSVAGLRGLPFIAHYSASKHGVVGLCRALANELGEFDIRVNTIHPNGVNTPLLTAPDILPMIEAVPHTLGPIFMNALPHPYIEPEDVSELVAFIVSDAGRYITGAQLPVDLGTLLR